MTVYVQRLLQRVPSVSALLAVCLAATLLAGCDLDEDPFSVVTPNEFFKTESEFVAAIAPVYAQVRDYQNNYFNISEHSSDEIMVPTRGTDWGDNGNWRRLTQHQWTAQHPNIDGAWVSAFTGVARANSVLAALNNTQTDLEQAPQFRAELRFLRAFFYYQLLDLYGNVPIVVEQGSSYEQYPQQPVSSQDPPAQQSRREVFRFLIEELTGCADLSAVNVQDCVENPSGGALANLPPSVEYGRASKWAGYGLLARLFVNAEVYTGQFTGNNSFTPGLSFWEEAEAAADEVISSGQFMLADNYFDNFAVSNASSPEIIWPATYKAETGLGLTLNMRVMHYNMIPETPWNGFTTIAEFYKGFDVQAGPDGQVGTRDDVRNDVRTQGFLVGRTYSEPNTGCYGINCFSNENTPTVKVRGTDTPLDITLEIPSITLESNPAIEAAGARPLKFEVDPNQTAQFSSNDLPLFRLSEMYLIRAEALNEMGQPSAARDALIPLRERAYPDYPNEGAVPTGLSQAQMRSLILQERGHEHYYEGLRRQDLVRYQVSGGTASGGPYTSPSDPYAPTFTAPWIFKDQSNMYRMLFPIPQPQLDANSKLTQNCGYGGGQCPPVG
ncbi:RagB/SusD family nutrient uptake outer membrane protein [Salisaeta longa]|uniref:RagB/SusD family nutrient uptake outer membrane protein n=1 Tax=Salisaeta longa TaxID=503170 RepID=UPI00146F3EBA|nr:RagB/SusD family nutrient uptake outer membrane protein [Salisaeta longa]